MGQRGEHAVDVLGAQRIAGLAAGVAHGADAFPAQAEVQRPVRRRRPFILRVQRQPLVVGGEVVAEVGEQGLAVLQQAAAFGAARRFQLKTGHAVVFAPACGVAAEQGGVLAGQAQ